MNITLRPVHTPHVLPQRTTNYGQRTRLPARAHKPAPQPRPPGKTETLIVVVQIRDVGNTATTCPPGSHQHTPHVGTGPYDVRPPSSRHLIQPSVQAPRCQGPCVAGMPSNARIRNKPRRPARSIAQHGRFDFMTKTGQAFGQFEEPAEPVVQDILVGVLTLAYDQDLHGQLPLCLCPRPAPSTWSPSALDYPDSRPSHSCPCHAQRAPPEKH